MTLFGQMPRCAKGATRKKGPRSTCHTTAVLGRNQGTRFLRSCVNGNTRRTHQEKDGHGKGDCCCIFLNREDEKKLLDCRRVGVREAQKLGPPSGTLKRIHGRHGACGWSVVQPDHDGELEPVHGCVGPTEAGIEAPRTIGKSSRDNILDGLRRSMCACYNLQKTWAS